MMRAASVLLGLLVAGSLYAGLSSAMAQNGERPKDVAVHGFQNHTACANYNSTWCQANSPLAFLLAKR